MPTPTPELVTTLPIPAWVQAAIVCLFILFSVGVFFTLRWVINRMASLIIELSKNYESFIGKRDAFWQNYQERREDEFGLRNNAVVTTLQAQTDTLKELMGAVQNHDQITRDAIARMDERTKAPRRATKPKPAA